MENDPTRDPRLREMMEACRPNSDDLADPEMAVLARQLATYPELARLHGRLQRFDAALADAFRDVPVPEGLESRILARLEAESTALRVPLPEPIPAGPAPDSGDRSIARVSRASRRHWLLAIGGLAATAAAVLLLVFSLLPRRAPIARPEELLVFAIEWFLNESSDPGQLFDPEHPSSQYPLSPSLVGLVSGQVSVIRWRSLEGFFGHHADAFDLIGPEGRVATVYAGPFSVEGLPGQVPLRAMHSTGEISASAWQEGDLMYVLVVNGGERAYERLLSAAVGPVT